MKNAIIKNTDFEEVAETRVDAKNRVTLGRKLQHDVSSYRVYRNSVGQIILDPMVTIPAHEAWLFKSKKGARLVEEGLADVRKGLVVKAKEDYARHAKNTG